MVHGLTVARDGTTSVFLTVTAPGRLPGAYASWDEWNDSAPSRFASLMRTLRKRGAGQLEYVRVLELHRARNGSRPMHVHALATDWRYVPIEVLRALVVAHGFGPRFQVEAVRSVEAASRYMVSAYLSKSHETMPGRRYRVAQASRGWPRMAPEVDPADVALNLLDPAGPVIPAGMSWWDWAERQERRGMGSLVFDGRSALALVRAVRGESPPGLFDALEGSGYG